jgi:hypothetical protein
MCIPPAAEFKIAGRYPTRIGVMGWTSVGSVGEVDAAGEYFYDSDTGYYYLYVQHICRRNTVSLLSLEEFAMLCNGWRARLGCCKVMGWCRFSNQTKH